MVEYAYKARDKFGKLISGRLDVTDETVLAEKLSEKETYLISARKVKKRLLHKKRLSGNVKTRTIIDFSHNMATILSAGVPILDGMRDIELETEDLKFKSVIRELYNSIEAGSTVSDAFSKHTDIFSDLYVKMIQAGEASGNLNETLEDIANFLEWQEKFKAEVKRVSIYPLMVTAIIGLLVIVLLTFVFPRMAKLVLSIGGTLPLITRITMGASDFLINKWYILLICLTVFWIAFKLYIKTAAGRYSFDYFKLRLPVVGNLLSKIIVSRFCHYMSTMFKAGIAINQALSFIENVLGNKVFSQSIKNVNSSVRSGNIFSQALTDAAVFPAMVIKMVAVGEKTGTIEKSLDHVSKYYDREVHNSIKKVLAMIEPIMISMMAVIVLLIALSIFLPIYSSFSQLK